MSTFEDLHQPDKQDRHGQSELGALLSNAQAKAAQSIEKNNEKSLPPVSIEQHRLEGPADDPRRASAEVAEDPTVPVSRSDDGWWKGKHDSLVKEIENSHCKTAFFGDSITDWMNVNLLHKLIGADASNFGIAGDRTENLLWRMRNGEMKFPSPGPETFVILIGTNNIAQPGQASNTNKQIYEGVNADLKEIRQDFPNSKVLVLGMLPRDEKPNTPNRQHISQTNKLIKGLADQKHIWYADISSAFLEADGTISPKVMSDFLHPTADEGYKRMFTAIKPHLDEIEKSGK